MVASLLVAVILYKKKTGFSKGIINIIFSMITLKSVVKSTFNIIVITHPVKFEPVSNSQTVLYMHMM